MNPINRLFGEVLTAVRSAQSQPTVSKSKTLAKPQPTCIDADSFLIPGEDHSEWNKFRAAVIHDLAPRSATEERLAESYASCLWRLERVRRYEAALTTARINSPDVTQTLAVTEGPMLRRDRIRLSEVGQRLQYMPGSARLSEARASVLERVLSLPDTELLTGADAQDFIETVYQDLPDEFDALPQISIDIFDQTFLESVGHPAGSEDEPYIDGTWTVAMVKNAVAPIFAQAEIDMADFLPVAQERLLELSAGSRRQQLGLEEERAGLIKRIDAADDKRLALFALPSAKDLEMIGRHECRLMRQLSQVHRQLRELQATRVRDGDAGLPCELLN